MVLKHSVLNPFYPFSRASYLLHLSRHATREREKEHEINLKIKESGGKACPHCHNILRSLKSYTNHVVVCKKNPEAANKLHRCDQCDYTSAYKPNLDSHKASKHGGLRPFQCQECDSRYRRKCELDMHIKRIHTINPVVCDICGKTLKNTFKLRGHKEKVHPQDREAYRAKRRLYKQNSKLRKAGLIP